MSIELHDLSKSFGGKAVLSRLNLRFEAGKITCICGPSGCGKTTLLNILLGLLPPDSGSISGLPSACSAVFQEDRLVESLSVLSNIRMALRRGYPIPEILRALEEVGLGESAAQPVRALSGGMKRRTAIVRAMLCDSPLLIMDEPFRGLDADTRLQVIRFVLNRRAGRTAVIVTHDPAEAELLGGTLLQFT